MGYDRGRRRGRDKRDGFGEEGFDPFGGGNDGFSPPREFGGGGDRFGGGGDRFGGGGGDRFGGGGPRGPGGGGGGPRGRAVVAAASAAPRACQPRSSVPARVR
jgi:cold shock protein